MINVIEEYEQGRITLEELAEVGEEKFHYYVELISLGEKEKRRFIIDRRW